MAARPGMFFVRRSGRKWAAPEPVHRLRLVTMVYTQSPGHSMARLCPALPPRMALSAGDHAELELLETLERGLSGAHTLFHSVDWSRTSGDHERHGEIDIVVVNQGGDVCGTDQSARTAHQPSAQIPACARPPRSPGAHRRGISSQAGNRRRTAPAGIQLGRPCRDFPQRRAAGLSSIAVPVS